MEHPNGIIKVQLAKFVESFKLSWPRALPLVLLNLRYIPFGKIRLTPFETFTGRPMRLDEGVYEFVKRKPLTLLYGTYQGLKVNSQLIEQSFHTVLLGDKDIQHHGLQPGGYVYRK